MTNFSEREQGFEAKYAHDEEFRFKVDARATKLIGQWAAGVMQLQGDAADQYVRNLIAADLTEAGSDDVIRKLRADFQAKGIDSGLLHLEKKMAECLATARQQVGQG